MSYTLYIDEQFLKDRTNISQNVDDKLIIPSILKCQDKEITEFIGKTIDNELKQAIDSTTFTPLQEELLDLIQKALAEFVCHTLYLDIFMRWQNKGASSPNIENGQLTEYKLLQLARQEALNNGEFYRDKIRCFLIDNKDTFPTFKENKKSYDFPFLLAKCNCRGYCTCR